MTDGHAGTGDHRPSTGDQAGRTAPGGDAIDRAWGGVRGNGRLAALFITAAIVTGGALYAITAYGPQETEPATVVGQYFQRSTGTRTLCGIEVQVASGAKGKAAGGGVCDVYDTGDQAVALVSSITGDVVGVRHAGRDLGRSGNLLVGLVPIFALATLVTGIIACRRTGEPTIAIVIGDIVAGAAFGLLFYWLWF